MWQNLKNNINQIVFKGIINQSFKFFVFSESKKCSYDIRTLQLDATDNWNLV